MPSPSPCSAARSTPSSRGAALSAPGRSFDRHMSDPRRLKIGIPQVDNSVQTAKGKPVVRRGRKARGLCTDVEVAQPPDQFRRNESSMAELTIVFRLRFAVALTAAMCLLLFAGSLTARAASSHTGEYIVQ